MGLNQQKWWFNGVEPTKMVILMGFKQQKW